MHPKDLSILDYTYSLPEDRIAKYPLPERDASRLLLYKNAKISEDVYRNIAHHLPGSSLLIFNNTKVIEARLLFQKLTGGIIEIFCLEPHEQYHDITVTMLQQERVLWQCLVGGASKWKRGQMLEKKISTSENEIVLHARYVEKRTGHFIIELSWKPEALSFAEILHAAGAIPLPPYIKRAAESSDADRYQTVYATWDGSVAAPTAGLHFTEAIFGDLEKKKIQKQFVTLHVGAGTFQPVKSEKLEEHLMHAEFIEVPRITIEEIRESLDRPIVAVGTTSLRTIESLYWLGLLSSIKENEWQDEMPFLSQWEPYNWRNVTMSSTEALTSLLGWMEKKGIEKLVAKTQIIIAPGYKARIANGLITNFHQPQSTLLLLVAALVGEHWKDLYQYALQNQFRFLSYGDGSLLWFDRH